MLAQVYRTIKGLLLALGGLASLYFFIGWWLPPFALAAPDAPAYNDAMQNEVVGLAVDYGRLAMAAHRDGLPLDVALRDLRAAGVEGLVIPEKNLAALVASGEVQARWGWQLLAEEQLTGRRQLPPRLTGEDGNGPFPGPFKPWRLILMPVRAETGFWLEQALQQRWPGTVESFTGAQGRRWLAVSVPRENPLTILRRHQQAHRYTFPVDEDSLPYHLMRRPLGFWPEDLRQGLATGFRILPVVEGAGEEGASPAAVLGPAADLPAGTVLLFGRDGLPGLEAGDNRWPAFMEEAGWHLGLVDGLTPPGQKELAGALAGGLVKIHAPWPEETATELVRRVREGRTQVLLLNSFLTLTGRPDDPGTLNGETVARLQTKLAAAGVATAWPAPLAGGLPAAEKAWPPKAGGGPGSSLAVGGLIILLPLLTVGGAARFAWGGAPGPYVSPLKAGLAVLLVTGLNMAAGLLLAAFHAHPVLWAGLITPSIYHWAPVISLALGAGVIWRLARPARTRLWRQDLTWGNLLAAGCLVFMAVLAVWRSTSLPLAPVDPKAGGNLLGQGLLLMLPVPTLELLFTVAPLFWALQRGRRHGRLQSRPLLLAGVFGQACLLAAFARVQTPVSVTALAAGQGLLVSLLLGYVLLFLRGRGLLEPGQSPCGAAAPSGGPINSGGNRP